MKNVIYINCWVEPWVKVAIKMQEEYDYKPIWWIGYSREDNSQNIIPQQFPGIIYQDNADAWKGRFPKEVEEKAPYYYLDVDFLKRHAHHELQAIKMMDRMDQDLRSFNFMERQRHFRNMLKQWMAAIDLVKPDLVISTAIPHRLYDYVLFWLCEEKNIPFLTIEHTQFRGRFFFLKNDFFSIENRFISDWYFYENEKNIDKLIPNDIKQRYDKVRQDYAQGAPVFMKTMQDKENQMRSYLFMIKRWFRKFSTVYRPYLLGKSADVTIIGHCAYDKRANRKYEESEGNIYQHERMILKINKYKNQLKEAYESLTTQPDFKEKYVIYFLHYQPEATSCPGGDIFVDQMLCVDMLLKNLPDNYMVYVKEHPHQFSRLKIGHTGRMRDLYDDLVKNKRVKLISTSIDSFKLISHAKAIGTICGTAGWEAIVKQKPVILFGISWYENYSKGVLRIKDEKSAQSILSFIENYQFDEHSLLAYLVSVAKNTYQSDYFKESMKQDVSLNDEENVNNLVKAIASTCYSK